MGGGGYKVGMNVVDEVNGVRCKWRGVGMKGWREA